MKLLFCCNNCSPTWMASQCGCGNHRSTNDVCGLPWQLSDETARLIPPRSSVSGHLISRALMEKRNPNTRFTAEWTLDSAASNLSAIAYIALCVPMYVRAMSTVFFGGYFFPFHGVQQGRIQTSEIQRQALRPWNVAAGKVF